MREKPFASFGNNFSNWRSGAVAEISVLGLEIFATIGRAQCFFFHCLMKGTVIETVFEMLCLYS